MRKSLNIAESGPQKFQLLPFAALKTSNFGGRHV